VLALTEAALLPLWEEGERAGELGREALLLAAAAPELGDDDPAKLTFGQRNAALLALYARAFGERLDGFVCCPACGEACSEEGTCKWFQSSRSVSVKSLPIAIAFASLIGLAACGGGVLHGSGSAAGRTGGVVRPTSTAGTGTQQFCRLYVGIVKRMHATSKLDLTNELDLISLQVDYERLLAHAPAALRPDLRSVDTALEQAIQNGGADSAQYTTLRELIGRVDSDAQRLCR
jgi:hypothetical protein